MLPSASRATLDGQSTSPTPSASVSAAISCGCKQGRLCCNELRLHCRFLGNTCICSNGVAQTGAGCRVDGDAKCASCDVGWTINHDQTQCKCTCVLFGISFCARNANLVCLLPLLGNICTCKNGVAQTGADCVVNGAAKCQSCNAGFTTNHPRTECIRTCVHAGNQSNCMLFMDTTLFCFAANTCTCKNGVGETGVYCPVNGAVKCESCNAGWTINDARSECIRKCFHQDANAQSSRFDTYVFAWSSQRIIAPATTARGKLVPVVP